MLKIKLLQTPGIELDGDAVILPFKRAEALLYYLAVKRSASRQELIALLWESEDETKGLKNLRNTLYAIKKAIGPDVLLSPQKAIISLNPELELDCDYNRFVDEKDFSAYQAPFLSGFSVRSAFALDEWIHRTRDKLHNQYLQNLHRQAQTARRSQDYDEAIRCCYNYLTEEPYDETMTVFLMKCLRETRQFARAAQTYQKLKELLSREMGVDPLDSTTMLYYEILNHWNAASDSIGTDVPIGREAVCRALQAAAATFTEHGGRRCSQLLLGETGSGKSELINHFLQSGRGAGLRTIRCECLRSDSLNPLSIWSRILRSLTDLAEAEAITLPQQALERIEKTIPLPGTQPREGSPLPPDQSFTDSVLLLFSHFGRQEQLLLVLDDLQWIDLQSLQLLHTLLRQLERGFLMLVLSTTWALPPEARQLITELEADGLLHRQVLEPLTRDHTELFLRRELGEDTALQLTERFYQESGGNLKLLTALTEAYRQNSDLTTSLKAMRDILLKRLGGLPAPAIRVVQTMSLFRGSIPSTLLLELMDGQEQALTDALLELRRRAVVEEFQSDGLPCFRFLHRSLRDLVRSQLSVYQRTELSRRIAELLSRRDPNADEIACREIAYHFRQAGDLPAALHYQLQALDWESIRRCEPFCAAPAALPQRTIAEMAQDAADCRQQLLALQRSGSNPPLLREMEEQLLLIGGRLALYQGDTQTAARLLGELTAADATGTTRKVQACELLAVSAYHHQATELLERYVTTGLRLLTRAPEPRRQARLFRLRGCAFCLRGDYDRAGYYLHEAAALLEKELPDPGAAALLAAVCGDLGRCARCSNDFVHAGQWFGKAMTLLKDADCAGQVWLYVHYGRTLFAVDDHLRAQALFSEALRIARARDELWGRTAAAAYCAFFQMMDGNHEAAAATLQEAVSCSEQIASPLEQGILQFIRTRIRRRLDLEQRQSSPLQALVPDPADDYARSGVRLCSGLPDVFEIQLLGRELRDGIASQLRYRSSDLYSKNKRFMSE